MKYFAALSVIVFSFAAHSALAATSVQYPAVVTIAPVAIYGNSVTLAGSGNAFTDEDARYWFQIGKWGSELSPTRPVRMSEAEMTFAQDVWYLEPNTEYAFRAVIENDLGIGTGDVVRFRTRDASLYRVPPVVAHDIGLSSESIDVSDPESPQVTAYVTTAGSPVQVHVEYGTTRSVTTKTPTQMVAVSGGVTFTLDALRPGRSYYYRIVAEDGASRMVTETKEIDVPRAERTSLWRSSRSSDSRAAEGTIWERLFASVRGEKKEEVGSVRDAQREDVIELVMQVRRQNALVQEERLSPVLHDVLEFRFTLTDTQYPSAGMFSFPLPEGCTYIMSSVGSFDRQKNAISAPYTFESSQDVLQVSCIVDTEDVNGNALATFTAGTISVTSNGVEIGGGQSAFAALTRGVVGLGSSTLIIIFATTIILAFGIIGFHDRVYGKPGATT